MGTWSPQFKEDMIYLGSSLDIEMMFVSFVLYTTVHGSVSDENYVRGEGTYA